VIQALGEHLTKLLEADSAAKNPEHAHLMKECPWYAVICNGEAPGDPEKACKPKSVKLTPRTPEASTVVKPTVPPGGPGLFHIKGRNLPPYLAG
jgi:hypothetical protein